MDDIIIHAPEETTLDKTTHEVLRRLKDNGLCIAPDKCGWAKCQAEFLGYMISGEGLEMANDNIATLKEIKPVSSLKEVQHFIGFVNFYRRFIKDHSRISSP